MTKKICVNIFFSDETFLKYIAVKIADEFDAGSYYSWRITIYNGSSQLCYTHFLRYKVNFFVVKTVKSKSSILYELMTFTYS
jgi:hypothetical protein